MKYNLSFFPHKQFVQHHFLNKNLSYVPDVLLLGVYPREINVSRTLTKTCTWLSKVGHVHLLL